MAINQTQGAAVPFIVDDYNLESIDGAAFDPIVTLHDADNVHPTEMSDERASAKYAKNGFLVRPDADGKLWCVTLRQLLNAVGRKATLAQIQAAIPLLEPKPFLAAQNQWIECPVVKVFGGDGDGAGHYVATATEINVGIIL